MLVNPACFNKIESFAGYETGREFSDMELLASTMTTDMRMGYFYICEDPVDRSLTDFQIKVTENYGDDLSVELEPKDGCRWIKITNASTRQLDEITLYISSDAIFGFTITIGDKSGSFGSTTTDQNATFSFDW